MPYILPFSGTGAQPATLVAQAPRIGDARATVWGQGKMTSPTLLNRGHHSRKEEDPAAGVQTEAGMQLLRIPAGLQADGPATLSCGASNSSG